MKERGKRKKLRNNHFMDVALDAYIRGVTITKLRETEDLMDSRAMGEGEALAEAGTFPERGPYRELWEQTWREMAAAWISGGGAPLAGAPLAGAIEQAVREAMLEEQKRRAAAQEETIEDTRHYAQFIATAMGRLLEEAGGEIEEMD